jgi:hypothetical protein
MPEIPSDHWLLNPNAAGAQQQPEPMFQLDEAWGDGAIVGLFDRWLKTEGAWSRLLRESDDDKIDESEEALALQTQATELLGELAEEPAQGLVGIAIKVFVLAYNEPALSGPGAWLTEALMLDIRRGVPGMKRLISPDGVAHVLPPKPTTEPA